MVKFQTTTKVRLSLEPGKILYQIQEFGTNKILGEDLSWEEARRATRDWVQKEIDDVPEQERNILTRPFRFGWLVGWQKVRYVFSEKDEFEVFEEPHYMFRVSRVLSSVGFL